MNPPDQTRSTTPSLGRRPALWRSYRTEIAILLAIVVLMLGVGAFVPQAPSGGNFRNILQAAAPLIIMSMGVLLVVITGGIDLSVGSVFSLTGMVVALAMTNGADAWTAGAAGLAVGLACGVINGALVGLQPFVVTRITYAVAGSHRHRHPDRRPDRPVRQHRTHLTFIKGRKPT